MITADDERSIVFYPVPPHAFPTKMTFSTATWKNISQQAWDKDHLISLLSAPNTSCGKGLEYALGSVFFAWRFEVFQNQTTRGKRVMSNNSEL